VSELDARSESLDARGVSVEVDEVDEVERLLEEMIDAEASDLFLSEDRPPSWRLDGLVTVTLHPPTTRASLERFFSRVVRPSQREHFDRTGDFDAGWSHPKLGRFRVHLQQQRGLLGAVIRSVPSGQLSFERLGLPPAVRSLAESARGLVLVTGSTGSGKSTTLAAMLHHINTSASRHIVTLEDPIEFVHDDLLSIVTQREIGTDARDFASGLRHVLRQSPDVILIGEMRDAETVSVALSAALTGHLVLSSLHTMDATQTLQRILSYYPEHLRDQVCMDLSLSLQGVVGQRLVPSADGTRRVAAVEVMLATPAIRRLIREQRVDELQDAMVGVEGMQRFDRALVDLHARGLITAEIGAAYASNPDEFRLGIQGMERGSALGAGELDLGPASLGAMDMRGILREALDVGASDIHLVAGSRPVLRVHGELTPLAGTEVLTPAAVRRLLFSLLSHSQRETYDLEKELDFALSVNGGNRFRVNAHQQRGTAAVAIRLIPNRVPPIESLGLPWIVPELAARTQGLVLVTGPTGSGKSTTLAAMVDLINHQRNCHLITIEDPIEFLHDNDQALIEQREIGEDSRSFASALKYILRQDPDVILVGEMRDTETIAAALTAAETGHLVLATLHANDAPAAVDRIVDVFPPSQQSQIRTQLASELLAVLSQRLVRRTDGLGRVGAFEVMVGTAAVRNLIRENKLHQLPSIMETAQRDGMVTMDRALADLIKRGLTTYEESLRYARNPSTIRNLLGR
jgi:pilus retraction protein PilT